MIKGIDHIGIAVTNIDETLNFLKESFGAEEYKRTEYPQLQQISSIVMLKGTNFEIMQPTGPNGPIGQFMKTRTGASITSPSFVRTLKNWWANWKPRG